MKAPADRVGRRRQEGDTRGGAVAGDLRVDIDACPGRTQKVIQEMLALLDGNRLVRFDVNSYFAGGTETTEQLDTALTALREECEKQWAEGKRILIQ